MADVVLKAMLRLVGLFWWVSGVEADDSEVTTTSPRSGAGRLSWRRGSHERRQQRSQQLVMGREDW